MPIVMPVKHTTLKLSGLKQWHLPPPSPSSSLVGQGFRMGIMGIFFGLEHYHLSHKSSRKCLYFLWDASILLQPYYHLVFTVLKKNVSILIIIFSARNCLFLLFSCRGRMVFGFDGCVFFFLLCITILQITFS